MGVQIKSIVTSVEHDHGGVGTAVLIAAGAVLLTVLVRAAYVAPLLGFLASRVRHSQQMQAQVLGMRERMDTPEGQQETFQEVSHRKRPASERDLKRFAHRITRVLADIEYFLREPLGWREGTAVVWAGMRGAVTVAAAQTLPDDTPQRSVLVLIAFAAAAISLLVQGGTIGPLLGFITPKTDPAKADEQNEPERTRIMTLMRTSTESIPEPPRDEDAPRRERFEASKKHRLAVITAQRSALLDARDNGSFDADLLEGALANLDADQIAIEMRSKLAG